MYLRLATRADVDQVVAIQEEGAIRALSHIFPQDLYPFPRDTLRARWCEEVADPGIHAYVVLGDDNVVVGFAATRGDELLHFGTAVKMWGTGLAAEAHDAVIGTLKAQGAEVLRLRVFEDNCRARRFYEKLGWRETATRSHTNFSPHPVMIEYRRGVDQRRGQRKPAARS
jgi:RimJ/RimL family protein N-acetyltransferase